MNHIQLFINNHRVDLDEDSPIALTFQVNNLAEMQNQQGNTSNQFKLPLTQRNRIILGFPDDIAFGNDMPYQQYEAKLVQDGLEIIPYGIAELNNIEHDKACITLLSGNVDFFDAVDGKLYEMGDSTSQWSNYGKKLVWKAFDHNWNMANVVNSQTKTDGWIWPVVDYGMISQSDFLAPIDIRCQRPGFVIKTAIDLVLQSAGYKGCGSLLDDPLYRKLICQFANDSFDHGTDAQHDLLYNSISVQTSQDFIRSHNTTSGNIGTIPFNLISSDPGRIYDQIHQGFFVKDITSINASLEFALAFTSTNPSHTTYSSKIAVQIRLYDDVQMSDAAAQILTELIVDYADRGNEQMITLLKQAISVDQVLQPGQGIKVTYEFRGFTGSNFTLQSGAMFKVSNKVQQVQYGQMVQCERIFPDISQKDLLKDILQRFGIICQTDNTTRTVSFNSLKDIVNNLPLAKDWTGKCINQGKQISFRLGNYAQINYMKYREDENVLPAGFANGQINIADTTLPAVSDLFQSQFAPTTNRSFFETNIAQILKVDLKSNATDFTVSTQPRILVDQKFNLANIGKTLKFTDGNRANDREVNGLISIPYFYKPEGNYNLCFCDMPSNTGKPIPGFKSKYFTEFQKVLQQTKKVIRYIMLSPRDILELDLLIPIYLQQDNAYFYINKIENWCKGKPCKVELVKLG